MATAQVVARASRRNRRALPAVLVAAVLGCGGPPSPRPPEPLTAVPAVRLARLDRGLNVARWFNQWGRRPPFGNHVTDADLVAIRSMGFRVVRLAVDPGYLYRRADPGRLDPSVLADLDSAVDRLLAHDLAVIVTPFPHNRILLEDSARAAAFARFWEALARNLSTRDPNRVFLEVVNEPAFFRAPDAWLKLQGPLLAAMRRGAPRHTLIASGPFWSSIPGLARVAPVPDPNVVYTVHFYQPHAFVYQGLAWAGEAGLHGLPYPADSARCARAVHRLADSALAAKGRRYCAGRWDAAALGAVFDQVERWREAHHAQVFLGEFGSTCRAPKQDRLAWLRDVRVELERRRIGWALWAWDDCFGLNARHAADGRLVLDADVLDALGLGETDPSRGIPGR